MDSTAALGGVNRGGEWRKRDHPSDNGEMGKSEIGEVEGGGEGKDFQSVRWLPGSALGSSRSAPP